MNNTPKSLQSQPPVSLPEPLPRETTTASPHEPMPSPLVPLPTIPPPPPPTFATNVTDPRSPRAKRWDPLEEITVCNFKAVKKAKIRLGKNVTILVGPNSCGKSSILQAIHWATRSATNITPGDTYETVLFDDLDYVPSSDPVGLFHNGNLGTNLNSNPISVTFRHANGFDGDTEAVVSILSIRNKGGVRVEMKGGSAVTPYKQNFHFISAYIPGFVGLSEKEKRTVKFDVRRKAASGQAGSVLRNILLDLKRVPHRDINQKITGNHLDDLNRYIREVYPDHNIDVHFNDYHDLNISATIGIRRRKRKPLDSASTGILQVIQIFAYMIFFKPRITLIEEPDSHIHPDKQRHLIGMLERAAAEFDTQVILTTHSHHIAREANLGSNIVWLNEGKVVPYEQVSVVRNLMGWGGLDKSIFFFTEDQDTRAITSILRQWPDYYQKICVCSCNGHGGLPKNDLLNGLLGESKLNIKVIIHRDRDFMTASEIRSWKGKFSNLNAYTWVTNESDIEAYFCDPKYIAALYDISLNEASIWIDEAFDSFDSVEKRNTYLDARRGVRQSLRLDENRETSSDLWKRHGMSMNTVKGKDVYCALKPVIQKKHCDIRLLESYHIPSDIVVADDLKVIIRKITG